MAGLAQFKKDLMDVWANKAPADRNPLDLVPIMTTVMDHLPEEQTVTKDWLDQLYNDLSYEHIGPTWGDEVFGCLSTLSFMTEMNPDGFKDLDAKYEIDFFTNKEAAPDPTTITIGDTLDISNGIREDAEKANTWEEMDAIIGGILTAANSNPTYAATLGMYGPMLSALQATMQGKVYEGDGVHSKLSYMNSDWAGAHFLDHADMEMARELINNACDMFEVNHLACKGFSAVYIDGKNAYVKQAEALDPNRYSMSRAKQQSEDINELEDKLYSISDIQRKMEAGESIFHRNSEEYTHMKNAVDNLMSVAKRFGFDPNLELLDGSKQLPTDDAFINKELTDALSMVYNAANAYAEKEVFGKEKNTSRGIERKNTALALMDLAKPDHIVINEKAVDRRAEKRGKSLSLDDLMAQEKTTNREKHRDRERHIVVLPEAQMGPKSTPKHGMGRGM